MPQNTKLVYFNTNGVLEVRSRNAQGNLFAHPDQSYGKPYLFENLDVWQPGNPRSDCIPKVLWRGNTKYDVYYINKKNKGMALRYTAISTSKNIPILKTDDPLNFSADGSITPFDPDNGYIYLLYQKSGLLYYACYKDTDNSQVFVDFPLNYNSSQIQVSGSVSIVHADSLQAYMAWTTEEVLGPQLAYATLTFPSSGDGDPNITVSSQVIIPRKSVKNNTFTHYSPTIVYKETNYGGKYIRIFHTINSKNVNTIGVILACYSVTFTPGNGSAIPDGDYPVLTEASDGSGKAIFKQMATAPHAYSPLVEQSNDYTDVYVVDPPSRRVEVLFIDTDDLRNPIAGTTPPKVGKFFWVSQASLLTTGGTGTTGNVNESNMAVSVDGGSEFS